MAGIRNIALLPLLKHKFPNELPTYILFFNDIYFNIDDVIELL